MKAMRRTYGLPCVLILTYFSVFSSSLPIPRCSAHCRWSVPRRQGWGLQRSLRADSVPISPLRRSRCLFFAGRCEIEFGGSGELRVDPRGITTGIPLGGVHSTATSTGKSQANQTSRASNPATLPLLSDPRPILPDHRGDAVQTGYERPVQSPV
jgi:hypothetical protein